MTAVSTPGVESAPYTVEEVCEQFDPVMGLEVHVELNTETKMFCGCANAFGAEPNTHVCPVCLGLPGSLPRLNGTAVESAIKIGLALNCQVRERSGFARKNYFYPDMPKNFQISQYEDPIVFDGYLDVPLDDGTTWRVEIERAHMEEDTGKSLHVGGATGRIHGADYSLLDYNRSGVPLIEIVTKPIIGAGVRAPEVARAYVTALRDVLRGLGVSDVRMDQGSMRCDANVSLMPKDATEFGTRTETKNVNSLRSVERAVRYEMGRHAGVLLSGGTIRQETRHFDEQSGTTSPGRPKETFADYRFFPEPDLPPLEPSRDWVETLRAALPERPWERRARIQTDWGLSDEELRDLVNADALDLVADTVDAGAPAGGRPLVVGLVPVPAGQHGGRRPDRARDHAGAGRPGHRAGRGRHADQQAGAPGRRRRPRGRGRARRRRRRAGSGRGQRRERADRRGGRGAGGPARRGREDPGRQDQGGRGDRRRGDEGHPGAGGRRACPGAGARALSVTRIRPGNIFFRDLPVTRTRSLRWVIQEAACSGF